MPNLLFEIGTEELPPGLINNLLNQLLENIITGLSETNIPVNKEETKTFFTPRRIAININGLPEEQPIKEIEVKGPDKSKAFDKNNNPTQAAIGFAKKYNLEPRDLITKKVNDIEYVFIKTKIGGQKTTDILSQLLPNSIRKTTGDKFMSWGNYDETFARPVRWILAILDKDVINFTYAGVKSSNYTYGHRFLSDKPIKIRSSKDYEKELEENYVIASFDKRKEKIIELISAQANILGQVSKTNFESLVNEVTNITEYPCPLICSFSKDFLSLPEIVIETVLIKHQRCFSFYNKSNKLQEKFLVITNGTETKNQNTEEVKRGNEKVVTARLNDASFFYKEDLKKPFTYEQRINTLKKITFQKGLGSIEEKVKRVCDISNYIYEILEKQTKLPCTKEDITNTAKLCKLDLTTQMVFEMPELQGKIGAIYAKENGFNENVCRGIKEHYTDTSHDNLTGQIIGLADKLDNIICLFSINKIPTGSADPFALRGQTQWIFNAIEVIQDIYNAVFKLSDLIDTYKEKITTEVIKKVKDFLTERLKLKYFASCGGLDDLVEAAFSIKEPLNNLYLIKENIIFLKNHFNKPNEEDKAFLTAAKRLVRIIESNTNGRFDINLLKLEEEKALLTLFEEINSNNFKNSEEYYMALKKLTNPINKFFDKVLVNDPDPIIKQTRHSLLKKGKDLFEKICDFNKIQERS